MGEQRHGVARAPVSGLSRLGGRLWPLFQTGAKERGSSEGGGTGEEDQGQSETAKHASIYAGRVRNIKKLSDLTSTPTVGPDGIRPADLLRVQSGRELLGSELIREPDRRL